VIVLGIAHADRVVRREPQVAQSVLQAARLVDAARQHHHGSLVEDHLQRQAQLLDGRQHRVLVRLPGGDDHAPDRERLDRVRAQQRDQLRARRLAEQLLLAAVGREHVRAVLGHDAIER
jgi:hypothetical protein